MLLVLPDPRSVESRQDRQGDRPGPAPVLPGQLPLVLREAPLPPGEGFGVRGLNTPRRRALRPTVIPARIPFAERHRDSRSERRELPAPQESAAHVITRPRFFIVVLPAVELDRKPAFVTVEIENVSTDRMLATKLLAGKATVPHQSPEELFGVGLFAAQAACVLEYVWRNRGYPALTPGPSPRGRGGNAGVFRSRVATMWIWGITSSGGRGGNAGVFRSRVATMWIWGITSSGGRGGNAGVFRSRVATTWIWGITSSGGREGSAGSGGGMEGNADEAQVIERHAGYRSLAP